MIGRGRNGGCVRIAVIGAGAVGGTIAALFDRAGHDVEVTARGDHAASIAEHGLRLSGAWGSHTAQVIVSDGVPRRRPELAFVTTKAQSARSAMLPAARLLGGVPVVVVQNGLDSVRTGKAALPNSDIVGGLALFAASYLSPGAVSVTAPGSTFIGSDGIPSLFVQRTMSAVMPVTAVENFPGAQWTKLIVNQINAFPAMTGMSAQEVVADARLRRALAASMREAARVGFAAEVRFESIQGLSQPVLRALAALPVAVGQVLPRLMAKRMGDVPNPGSTLQSIRRGQPTEIDHLNGAVVAAAIAAGTDAPINAEIVRLVHEVERTGRFLSPDQVVAALG